MGVGKKCEKVILVRASPLLAGVRSMQGHFNEKSVGEFRLENTETVH